MMQVLMTQKESRQLKFLVHRMIGKDKPTADEILQIIQDFDSSVIEPTYVQKIRPSHRIMLNNDSVRSAGVMVPSRDQLLKAA